MDEFSPLLCRWNCYAKTVVTTTAKCGTTCIGVDENRIAFTLADCGSLLTKILFSYRSTEVWGILIVMKILTERYLGWGVSWRSMVVDRWRAWGILCLHSHFESKHRGALRWLHSTHPYGKIEYDTCFEMIDVVLIEMTNDRPFDMIYDALFDIKWLSYRDDIWPSFR